MREHIPLMQDVATFLIIAAIAYPFAFVDTAGTVALVGKIVFVISIVLTVAAFTVKRPPPV